MAQYIQPTSQDVQNELAGYQPYAEANSMQINPQRISMNDYANMMNQYHSSLQDPGLNVQRRNLDNLRTLASLYGSGISNNAIQQIMPSMSQMLQGGVEMAKSGATMNNMRSGDSLAQQAQQAYGNSNNAQDAMLFTSLMNRAGTPVNDKIVADQTISEQDRYKQIQNLIGIQSQLNKQNESLAMQKYSTQQHAEDSAAARAQSDRHHQDNLGLQQQKMKEAMDAANNKASAFDPISHIEMVQKWKNLSESATTEEEKKQLADNYYKWAIGTFTSDDIENIKPNSQLTLLHNLGQQFGADIYGRLEQEKQNKLNKAKQKIEAERKNTAQKATRTRAQEIINSPNNLMDSWDISNSQW